MGVMRETLRCTKADLKALKEECYRLTGYIPTDEEAIEVDQKVMTAARTRLRAWVNTVAAYQAAFARE